MTGGFLTASAHRCDEGEWDTVIRIEDTDRVRIVTLDRPEALNAFNEALYDALCDALIEAAADPAVAVVLLTGAGRAFSAGTDLVEMARRNAGDAVSGTHGFPGLIDQLAAFPKPLILAINGLALGIGATAIGLADLVFMSADARIKCPFTSLGVAPEAAGSHTFPALIGRQRAAWVLLSSEWFGAEECVRLGLALKAVAPDELLPEALRHARILAAKSIASLVASKQVLLAGIGDGIARARERENEAFRLLLGAPANREALAAFAEHREPDFAAVDARVAEDRAPS
ncbi:enoyl-CoA hydratase-related protein [Yinghuangia sp. ASG 101]|uniref:enoyl-CoA hydratase/isomerase family protein n=1 Tax=Yinghuangia sp. ASG 101 TaxID=2896848 RepID=UPI001E5E2ECE|nr:enoyl-CoA hydratase-related protein [Yinghuangia sp. ASG 101]UGQ10303.1 enoyl-CoA hydratase-related protein [Yinghuangia sp. ASG 101]